MNLCEWMAGIKRDNKGSKSDKREENMDKPHSEKT